MRARCTTLEYSCPMARGPPVTTFDNDLAFSSCNQDLRQDYVLTRPNCSSRYRIRPGFPRALTIVPQHRLGLTNGDNSYLVDAENFDYSSLQTANARFRVQGVASTQCPRSQATGVVGVLPRRSGSTTPRRKIQNWEATLLVPERSRDTFIGIRLVACRAAEALEA